MVRISSPKPASARRFFVFSDSIGSTSVANICPCPSSFSSIALVWPPYPSVASKPVCPGFMSRKSMISFTIMDMCMPAGVFPLLMTCSIVSLYFSGFNSLYFPQIFGIFSAIMHAALVLFFFAHFMLRFILG